MAVHPDVASVGISARSCWGSLLGAAASAWGVPKWLCLCLLVPLRCGIASTLIPVAPPLPIGVVFFFFFNF